MIILSAMAAVLFAALYLNEHMKYCGMNRELIYINKRLTEISYTTDCEFILVPSDNSGIREIAAGLNRLLQNFHIQKAENVQKENSMKNVLTNISHDLRTPLTVLKGYSEILSSKAAYKSSNDNSGECDNLGEIVSKIDEKADELIAAIEEYFTISKIESGDMRVELRENNISQICHEIMLDYYELLEKKGFEVEIQIENTPVYADVDSEVLKRILKNIIDNAVKHGGSGKYLAIRLRKENFRIFIEIEDHGEGISLQEQERIFDRNYTANHRQGGNGLGLAIAKSLAVLMKADIWVSSVPMERTVFTVNLKCKS